MTQTVALGQAFLIRRDFTFELQRLQKDVMESAYYREDRAEPKKDSVELLQKLYHCHKIRIALDNAIERANNLQDTVEFQETKLSLNEARKVKVNLQNALNTQNEIIQHVTFFSNRIETENTVVEGVLIPVQKKYNVILDLDLLKQEAKNISKDLRTLDSLIQKADWSLQVEIPETDI